MKFHNRTDIKKHAVIIYLHDCSKISCEDALQEKIPNSLRNSLGEVGIYYVLEIYFISVCIQKVIFIMVLPVASFQRHGYVCHQSAFLP